MADVLEGVDSVLAVVAHPDDESFGCGSFIAMAAARGAGVTVCCASLGEAGELAPGVEPHGRSLAEIRDAELQSAADHLGVAEVRRLGLLDSGWDGAPPEGSICATPGTDLAEKIGAVIDQVGPQLVVTLAGDDGHRDHLRVKEAVVDACRERPPGRLYAWCLPNALMRRWAEEMTRLRPDTAHLALEIASLGTPPGEITDVLDATDVLEVRRRAIAAHRSQTSPYDGLPDDLAQAFLSHDHLRRLA